MTLQVKVAEILMRLIKLNSIDIEDLFAFSEEIIEVVKKDLEEKCSETK